MPKPSQDNTDACMKGKATCASFPASKNRQAKSVLDLVHSDLWGPSPVTSIGGTCYMLPLTDDNSQWLWVIFLLYNLHIMRENLSLNSGINFSRNVVYTMNSLHHTLLSRMESLNVKNTPSLITFVPF